MLSIQTQIKLYDIVYLLIHNGYNYTMRYKLDKKKTIFTCNILQNY